MSEQQPLVESCDDDYDYGEESSTYEGDEIEPNKTATTTTQLSIKRLNRKNWFRFGVKSFARQCTIVDDSDKTNLFQTLINLINANLGTGILAMPFVVRLGGYWGIATVILIGILANYTGKNLISLLYEDAEDGSRIRVRDTYVDIGEAFSPGYGKYMVHFANCFDQLSHCALLLIMPGTVIAHTFPHSNMAEGTWIFLLSLLVLPAAFLRKMHQISWVSLITVVTAVSVSICVLCYSLTHYTHWTDDVMPSFDIDLVPIGLGIVMVTFSSQAYLPAIERGMKDPEIFDPLMDFAYILVTVFKLGIGVIVFLGFTDRSDQIMTLNLPHDFFGRLINVCVIVTSLSFYTVPIFTIFDIIENQLDLDFLKPIRDQETFYLGLNFLTPNLMFRLGFEICIILFAVAVPHFSLLMAFVGSLTGMVLVFIYPSLFYLKIRWDILSSTTIVVNILIIMFAVCGGTLGVVFSTKEFYSIYNEEK